MTRPLSDKEVIHQLALDRNRLRSRCRRRAFTKSQLNCIRAGMRYVKLYSGIEEDVAEAEKILKKLEAYE